MKIDDYGIGSLNGLNHAGKAQENKRPDDAGSFADQLNQVLQKALEESLGASNENKEKVEEALLNPAGLTTGVNAVSISPALATSSQAVSALDELLSKLEEYESALANPAVSLKQLDPLVAELGEKAQALESRLPSMDDSLASLANQVITQAQVESIKFRRGDYVE